MSAESTSQVDEVLVQLLERAVSGIDAAVEFSQAEIPNVVQQLLMWHFVESLILFVLAMFLFAVSVYVPWRILSIKPEIDESYTGRTQYKQTQWHTKDGCGTGLQFTVLLAIIPFFIACLTTNLTWLKIWVAPKLYLIEYSSNLLK